MKSIKKILFPTDFSKSAQNAFRHALYFATKTGASITVLHVVIPEYETLDLPVMAVQATKEKIESAKEVSKNFIDHGLTQVQAAGKLDHTPVIHTKVELGGVSDLVTNTARKDDIDLIVMGTQYKHNVFENIFGSIASNVLANCRCNMMIIPDCAEKLEMHQVVYATSLTKSDPEYIKATAALLEPFSPILYCVHVKTEEDTDLKFDNLKQHFENKDIALQLKFEEVEGEKVADKLNEFVENIESDILVMSSPHRPLWERIFHASVSRKLSMHCRTPLLVLRDI